MQILHGIILKIIQKEILDFYFYEAWREQVSVFHFSLDNHVVSTTTQQWAWQ